MKKLAMVWVYTVCALAQEPMHSVSKERPQVLEASYEEKVAAFHAEADNQERSAGGCILRQEDKLKAKKDADYAALMDKICEAEKIAVKIANADRAKYCKKPLALDQRLSYVSRMNAVDTQHSGSIGESNAHGNWWRGKPQSRLKRLYPAAAKLIRFERENYFGMGGSRSLRDISAKRLAESAVSDWLNSQGHHAPIIDCENAYIGVGFYWNDAHREWIGYMSFGELQGY